MVRNIMLLTGCFIFFFFSCVKSGHKYIYIKNDSNIDLMGYVYFIDSFLCIDKMNIDKSKIIQSNSTYEQSAYTNCSWENCNFNSYPIQYCYLIPIDTLRKYPCDSIWKYKKYTRKIITLDSMYKYNWTITYP